MNSTEDINSKHGIKEGWPTTTGDKIAAWGIVLMLIWLVWNQ